MPDSFLRLSRRGLLAAAGAGLATAGRFRRPSCRADSRCGRDARARRRVLSAGSPHAFVAPGCRSGSVCRPGRHTAAEPEIIDHKGFNTLRAELEGFAAAIEGTRPYPLSAPEVLHTTPSAVASSGSTKPAALPIAPTLPTQQRS